MAPLLGYQKITNDYVDIKELMSGLCMEIFL